MENKKVFLIHGLKSAPNAHWFPWIMSELKKHDVWACSLAMPKVDNPIFEEWMNEIIRQIDANRENEIYLVGHSLGGATVLNYLQDKRANPIAGAVVVSTMIEKSNSKKVERFYESFDFEKMKANFKDVAIIHGDNDDWIDVKNAYALGEHFNVEPIIIPNGGHLNGSAGFRELPQALDALLEMMNK